MTWPENKIWENAPTHPDPVTDLGYDIQELTVIPLDDRGHHIILPGTDEHLLKDEFIVASTGSICTLEDCR